jgi:hypothetical protein
MIEDGEGFAQTEDLRDAVDAEFDVARDRIDEGGR